MTKIQWTTVLACSAYLIWEFVLLADWKSTTDGPLIRVDLIVVYPILLALLFASVWQIFRK